MLDFIVLGYVPGTTIQITFTWVMALATIASMAGALYTVERVLASKSYTTLALNAWLIQSRITGKI